MDDNSLNRGLDDFDAELRTLLVDLVEEFESPLREEGRIVSLGPLLGRVDDPEGRSWLLREIYEVYREWLGENADAELDAFRTRVRVDIAGMFRDESDSDTSGSGGLNSTSDTPPEEPPFAHWPKEFEFIRQIDEGGTAKVYLARERAVHRKVALKIPKQAIRPTGADSVVVERIRKRFKREGQILGQLAAAGVRAVPQFHRFAEIGESRWRVLVMEYVRGLSLSEFLKRRKASGFDMNLYARLEQFSRDLHTIHVNGQNHLDLKPSNIHIRQLAGTEERSDTALDRVGRESSHADRQKDSDEGPWTALDWGFGRSRPGSSSFEASAEPTPRDDDLGFTRRFMAPEQVLGGIGWVPAKTDVFALGAIQHLILTGQHLLPRGLDVEELDRRVGAGEFDEARARLRVMTEHPSMAQLALDCLETDPTVRPDAVDIAERIKKYFDELKREADELLEKNLREDAERQKGEARARARRKLIVTAGSILMISLVAVSAAAVLAEIRSQRAVKAESIANTKTIEAKAAQVLAETKKQEAETARGVAELKTKEAQRSEFLREAEAATVAMKAGLFDKARRLLAQAQGRPGADNADRIDLNLEDLRAAMFLNDLKAVDDYLATLSGRTDLSPKQRARLAMETAVREMHRSMADPEALLSSREGPRDKHILDLLEKAKPNLDPADRFTVLGWLATTFDSASAAYQAAIDLEPRHPYASSYLLEANLLAGRTEAALTQANAWAAATPGDPLPWFYRAALLTSVGRRAEASEALVRLRAADGAGRAVSPAMIAQCEAAIRVVGVIADGLNEEAFGGFVGAASFSRKLIEAINVPGGWVDINLFTAPLPPGQRRSFGAFTSGMLESMGLGPLIHGPLGIFSSAKNRQAALDDLADPSGFIAPGQCRYFEAVLMIDKLTRNGPRNGPDKMEQLALIGRRLEQAADGAALWDIRGLCLILSAGCDIQRSNWSREQCQSAASRNDFVGHLRTALLISHFAYLRLKAGISLVRAASLPHAGRRYRDILRQLAKLHGNRGVIQAVALLDPRTRSAVSLFDSWWRR